MSVFVVVFDVDFYDEVLVYIFYVFEVDIVEDIGVVDEDIDVVESFDSSFDDFVIIFDVVVVGNGFVIGGFDFVDDNIGSLYDKILLVIVNIRLKVGMKEFILELLFLFLKELLRLLIMILVL